MPSSRGSYREVGKSRAMLKVYNTLTRKKEPFKSIQPGRVRMYVCGVTVYDYCHLGHARSAIIFDLIRRYLAYKGWRVKYVRNFTDVDDKIINRAREEGRSWREVAETYTREYDRDMAILGVAKANIEPKATEHVAEMIRMIKRLVKANLAYPVDGDVYFRVEKFKSYGKLSKRKLDEMLAGARVEVDERKENPLDFALWKASKPDEPAWESPWGLGRPGWHIECSAMAIRHLGQSIDIHGGGKDLAFPHHENEIAQSEGSTGKRFARYWIHNGFVTIDQEKMSKSLGNFFTIREIFEKSRPRYSSDEITAEVLRYFLLSTHYRSPIDFSDQALDAAKAAMDHFYTLLQKLEEARLSRGEGDRVAAKAVKAFVKAFEKAMDDDFNTAGAIAQLQRLRGAVNRAMDQGMSRRTASSMRKTFLQYGKMLGLLQVADWKSSPLRISAADDVGVADQTGAAVTLGAETIKRLVNEREEARKAREWARADEIREQLARGGVILEDRPDGTTRIRR